MLTKQFDRVFHPSIPASPGSPGGYVCYSSPATGHWEQHESTIKLYPDTGVKIPPGALSVTPVYKEGTSDIDYFLVTVLVTEWVEDTPAGPPTCTYYDPVPAQEFVPARVVQTAIIGWDATAISVQSHEASCVAEWTMERVVGAYVGLTPGAGGGIEQYTHAFYFHTFGGRAMFRLRESGVNASGDREYTPGDTFRIRRDGARVTYWHNDALLYRSKVDSAGAVFLGTSLYASGDTVPSAVIADPPQPGAHFTGEVPPDYYSEVFTLATSGEYRVVESADGASCDWTLYYVGDGPPVEVMSGIEGYDKTKYLEAGDYGLLVEAYGDGGPFDILIEALA